MTSQIGSWNHALPRKKLARWMSLLVLAAIAALCVDGIIWTIRNRRVLEGLQRAGAVRIGSLLDWPLGKEYRAVFVRAPSSDEWTTLRDAIGHRPRNTTVHLAFPRSQVSPAQLNELKSHGAVRIIEVESEGLR